MAVATKATKKTARGRAQDRSKVAGGQKYEVSYEAKKTGRSAPAVKRAVKKVGNVRSKARRSWREKSRVSCRVPAGQSGGHSGQVSPMDPRTSRTSATASSGDTPAGGCCRAMSTA